MKFISVLVKYILPIIIIIFAFSVNALAGLAILLISLAVLLYVRRASLLGLIANAKYSNGQIDQALRLFKKSYDTKKANPGTIISYGYILLKTGHPEEAEKILDGFLKSKPAKDNEHYAKANLALVYWKTNRLDQAVATLQEVIAEYKTTTVYGSLGYLLIVQGDLDKALEFNREAYDYNNSNAIILDNLAQNYFLKGMFTESREIFEKLMGMNPTFPEAYYDYALLLIEQGDREKAAEMLEKALVSKFSYLSNITKETITDKLDEITDDEGEESDDAEDTDDPGYNDNTDDLENSSSDENAK